MNTRVKKGKEESNQRGNCVTSKKVGRESFDYSRWKTSLQTPPHRPPTQLLPVCLLNAAKKDISIMIMN